METGPPEAPRGPFPAAPARRRQDGGAGQRRGAVAAGLAARPAAAAARLQGGDAALEGHALPAAEAAGPDRVPAPAARPAPALPAPARAPRAPGGGLRAGAAGPAAGHAACQPHGGRVPLQLHGGGGRGHAAPLPAQARHPPQVRAQRGCPAGAGAVQAPESAAAVRVPERPAGEPGAAGQGDAAGAQGGATGHPAGRLHRRHDPEPPGRGELRPAAVPGGVPGADGGSPVPAVLPDLLPAPAGPCPPHGAPGRARPAPAGRGGGRGASPGPERCGELTLDTGNRFLPGSGTRGAPPDEGFKDHGHNSHGILQLRRGVSGTGGLTLRVLCPTPVPAGSGGHSLVLPGDHPSRDRGSLGSARAGGGARDGASGGDFGHSKPRALGMGVCCNTDPHPGIAVPSIKVSVWKCRGLVWDFGGWVGGVPAPRGWGERPGLL